MDTELLAEQLLHTIDNLRFEIRTIGVENDHQCAILEHKVLNLEKIKIDHEERIRIMQSGVMSFKMWSGLGAVCAMIVSLVALVRSIIGN